MDSDSYHQFYGYPQSAEHEHTTLFNHPEHPEVQCIVCRRDYTPGTEGNEVSDSIIICRECKSLVVDDNEATPPIRNFRRRRQQRVRASRYGSSESVEDLFSQQFSQLITLVRQSHEIQGEDGETPVTLPPRTGYSSARNWPRSWQRSLSDNETESVDHGDSLFGETDSTISFYVGESEASFDGHSVPGREAFFQQDHESHFYSDSDIDPMHAGLDQWNSDDEDEEVDWEDVNMVQLIEQHGNNQDNFSSPNGSMSGVQNGRLIHWQVNHHDLFADSEEPEVLPSFGNAGDYLDARGFEELLEQLAENDDSRRGAPPASVFAIRNLPLVIISKDHDKNVSLVCAVCKDPLAIGAEAKQLPCLHLYHPPCILPWLKTSNSCPICRYELPTDDLEYEEGKRGAGITQTHETRHQNQAERSVMSSDIELDEAQNELIEAVPEQADPDGGDCIERSLNREIGRWYLIAAAPIVSIVGIALVLWFRKSAGNRKTQCRIGEQDPRQPHRSHNTSVAGHGRRRWWSFF